MPEDNRLAIIIAALKNRHSTFNNDELIAQEILRKLDEHAHVTKWDKNRI